MSWVVFSRDWGLVILARNGLVGGMLFHELFFFILDHHLWAKMEKGKYGGGERNNSNVVLRI
jgi:hypothetical protein